MIKIIILEKILIKVRGKRICSRYIYILSLSVICSCSIVGCSTLNSVDYNAEPINNSNTLEVLSKADLDQLGDLEWANQFFISQVKDERFNPDGLVNDTASNNCGPASFAMVKRQRDQEFLKLSAQESIDHARAMMHPHYPEIGLDELSESAHLYYKDNLILINDDQNPVYLQTNEQDPLALSLAQGIRSDGANPAIGSSWTAIKTLLNETGAVIAQGHITADWKRLFSEQYGETNTGFIPHFIALFPASTEGQFVVCDPMHRGGAVLMNQSQLSVFFKSPASAFSSSIQVIAWNE